MVPHTSLVGAHYRAAFWPRNEPKQGTQFWKPFSSVAENRFRRQYELHARVLRPMTHADLAQITCGQQGRGVEPRTVLLQVIMVVCI
jgi:hypothetical protein